MIENIIDTKFENMLTPTQGDSTTDDINIIDIFTNLLEPLQYNGWQFVKIDLNNIIMNKKFHELEEINIEYKNSVYHFSLPLKNSVYSYYKKFDDRQQEQTIQFFKAYIEYLN